MKLLRWCEELIYEYCKWYRILIGRGLLIAMRKHKG
jgi:hypothetical protein